MKISIIGLGSVGKAAELGLAKFHEVSGYDIDGRGNWQDVLSSELTFVCVNTDASEDSTLDMVILNSRSETRKGLWEPYKLQFKELKPIGSVAYKMGLTAVGDADIFATLRPKNEWDICAGTCLINESGGKVIDLNGEALTFNNKKTLIEPGLIAGYQSSVDKTYKVFNER